ncbi:hypothetical protein JOQ06_012603 [Pogonophryne albipinna]|uniref:Uncharacterized protein n=1 Tax=Pogonophryne albipinna TaxID=1090488 RepID=A0AAD6BJK1_9TELE|nr:hypothetical protein JOQ06_012603 [Pogonophryne albipinna]
MAWKAAHMRSYTSEHVTIKNAGQGWKVGEAGCPITAQAIKDERLVCGQRERGKTKPGMRMVGTRTLPHKPGRHFPQ